MIIRVFGFLVVVGAVFGLSWDLLNQKMPTWEEESRYLLLSASEAGTSPDVWQALGTRAEENLPSIYPFSVVHNLLSEGEQVTRLVQDIDLSLEVDWNQNQISVSQIEPVWKLVSDLDKSLNRVVRNIESLPRWALPEVAQKERDQALAQLEIFQVQMRDLRRLERVWRDLVKKEERVLILLQNRNEPRSTGGFVGSLVLLDFSETGLEWQFSDIYELDRLFTDGEPAPEWFHGLSKTISLRDMNFWPDFRTSSQQYRQAFKSIGEKVPGTIVGLNLSVIETFLSFGSSIEIAPWGVRLDQYNFDLALQFLVESKISGRFAVKKPVLQFAQQLLSPEYLSSLDLGRIRSFDWESFRAQKNLLVHSQNIGLQKVFENWGLDGQIRRKPESDNFLQFDFVSVGANKSEKFVWTKLWHDSDISPDGMVKNTLQIRRTHALQPNEIESLLGSDNWPPNIKDLLTEDLKWVLGQGQSRIVLRVMVPLEARLIDQKNPSGVITSVTTSDFKIWEIPLNVVPGESIEATLEYETSIARGSQRWRPYFLQLVGTPARDKTEILKTISTGNDGDFSAQTRNIGRPTSLIDQDFRAVITFD